MLRSILILAFLHFDLVASGGDVTYGIQERSAFVAIDVADPRNPRTARSITIGGVLVEITGSVAVAQALNGIHLYSLADPLNPVETYFTPVVADVIAADGDRAYLGAAGLVQVMDLTNASRPALSTTALHPLSPMQIAASKGKIVIADRYALRILGPDTAPPPPAPPTRRRVARGF